jgi:predicted site-specific integrase-resolvase
MSAKEAAAALGVSRSTLTELIKAGHLKPMDEINPLLARPRAYRFRASDVEYLKAHPPDRRQQT